MANTTQNEEQGLAPQNDSVPEVRRQDGTLEFSKKHVNLLRRTLLEGASDTEASMFIQKCKRYGLDPFTGQIHAVQRWNSKKKREELSVQVGIDGFRLIADRTGKWRGIQGPYWCGPNGEWTDVWLQSQHPLAARVGIIRADFDEVRWATALWDDYVETYKSGDPVFMWSKMGSHMLAKCAESLGLRATFPDNLSGLYTDAEMGQAGGTKIEYDDAKEIPSKPDSGATQHGPAPQASTQQTASQAPKKNGASQQGEEEHTYQWQGEQVGKNEIHALTKLKNRFEECETPACIMEMRTKGLIYADREEGDKQDRALALIDKHVDAMLRDLFSGDLDRVMIWNVMGEAYKRSAGDMITILNKIKEIVTDLGEDNGEALAWTLLPYQAGKHIYRAQDADEFDNLLVQADKRLQEAVESGAYTEDVADIAKQKIWKIADDAAERMGIELQVENQSGEELLFGTGSVHNDQG